MPPTQRRRRVAADDDAEDEITRHNGGGPSHHGRDPDESDDEDGGGGDEVMQDGEDSGDAQLIKKMVRYALACEFSRTVIRRDGIKDKVLGPHGRSFKRIFEGAQKQLRQTFGMHMVELPVKDRAIMTTEQKRKAAKSGTQPATSSNSYILCSVLDNRYRTPTIIGPAHVHSPDGEAAYTALYTTIISIIVLSDGELSDPRLRRYLTRLNAGESMPSTNPSGRRNNAAVEKTDVVLARMQRQGYLTKVTEPKAAGDEDTTTWFVGPRGKTEVDNESIALYLRKVYGGSTEELEKQLQASLKVKEVKPEKIEYERANPGRYARRDGQGEEEEEEEEEEESAGEEDGDPGPSTRGAKRRRQRDQTSDEEEDEDDE